MSLLELYSKGSMTGVAGPSVKRSKNIVSTPSNLKPDNAGALGDTYADATLEAARSGKNALASRDTIVAQQPSTTYMKDWFKHVNKPTNNLLNLNLVKNYYGPGNFNLDPLPYLDRQFLIQNASMGQAAATPSVLQAAQAAALVITPVNPNIGTVASEPFNDARYVATIGYDYVLYTTRGGYG